MDLLKKVTKKEEPYRFTQVSGEDDFQSDFEDWDDGPLEQGTSGGVEMTQMSGQVEEDFGPNDDGDYDFDDPPPRALEKVGEIIRNYPLQTYVLIGIVIMMLVLGVGVFAWSTKTSAVRKDITGEADKDQYRDKVPVAESKNRKPTVDPASIHVVGDLHVAKKINLEYEYKDPEGDDEGETLVIWFYTKDTSSAAQVINTAEPDGGIIIPQEAAHGQIHANLIPCDVHGCASALSFPKVDVLNTKPVASEVTLVLNRPSSVPPLWRKTAGSYTTQRFPRPGWFVYVSHKFSDGDGDAETNTKVTWGSPNEDTGGHVWREHPLLTSPRLFEGGEWPANLESLHPKVLLAQPRRYEEGAVLGGFLANTTEGIFVEIRPHDGFEPGSPAYGPTLTMDEESVVLPAEVPVVSGTPQAGSILKSLFQDPSSADSHVMYQWEYARESTPEQFEPILGAVNDTLPVTGSYSGGRVRVGACLSNAKLSTTQDGDQISCLMLYSESVTVLPSKPVAVNVGIVGLHGSQRVLVAQYQFWDADGDKEDGSTVIWKMADDPKEAFRDAPSPPDNAKELPITKDLYGKYLRFEVTPRTKKESGAIHESETIHLTPKLLFSDRTVHLSYTGENWDAPLNSELTGTIGEVTPSMVGYSYAWYHAPFPCHDFANIVREPNQDDGVVWTLIEEHQLSDNVVLPLHKEVAHKFVVLALVPHDQFESKGVPELSEIVHVANTPPAVSEDSLKTIFDGSVTNSARIGSILEVESAFSDQDGDQLRRSMFVWRSGLNVSETALATGKQLLVIPELAHHVLNYSLSVSDGYCDAVGAACPILEASSSVSIENSLPLVTRATMRRAVNEELGLTIYAKKMLIADYLFSDLDGDDDHSVVVWILDPLDEGQCSDPFKYHLSRSDANGTGPNGRYFDVQNIEDGFYARAIVFPGDGHAHGNAVAGQCYNISSNAADDAELVPISESKSASGDVQGSTGEETEALNCTCTGTSPYQVNCQIASEVNGHSSATLWLRSTPHSSFVPIRRLQPPNTDTSEGVTKYTIDVDVEELGLFEGEFMVIVSVGKNEGETGHEELEELVQEAHGAESELWGIIAADNLLVPAWRGSACAVGSVLIPVVRDPVRVSSLSIDVTSVTGAEVGSTIAVDYMTTVTPGGVEKNLTVEWFRCDCLSNNGLCLHLNMTFSIDAGVQDHGVYDELANSCEKVSRKRLWHIPLDGGLDDLVSLRRQALSYVVGGADVGKHIVAAIGMDNGNSLDSAAVVRLRYIAWSRDEPDVETSLEGAQLEQMEFVYPTPRSCGSPLGSCFKVQMECAEEDSTACTENHVAACKREKDKLECDETCEKEEKRTLNWCTASTRLLDACGEEKCSTGHSYPPVGDFFATFYSHGRESVFSDLYCDVSGSDNFNIKNDWQLFARYRSSGGEFSEWHSMKKDVQNWTGEDAVVASTVQVSVLMQNKLGWDSGSETMTIKACTVKKVLPSAKATDE